MQVVIITFTSFWLSFLLSCATSHCENTTVFVGLDQRGFSFDASRHEKHQVVHDGIILHI